MPEFPADSDEAQRGQFDPDSLLRGKSQYLPDELAPPIDRDRLGALVRKQLPDRSVRTLLEMTMKFRCWHVAYQEILMRELESMPPTEEPESSEQV